MQMIEGGDNLSNIMENSFLYLIIHHCRRNQSAAHQIRDIEYMYMSLIKCSLFSMLMISTIVAKISRLHVTKILLRGR